MPTPSSQNSGALTLSRVRVWSDELQTAAWVLLPRCAGTVSDVAASIAGKLGLSKNEEAFYLFIGDALVLPSEDSRLIRDGDEVAIKNKRPYVDPTPGAPRKKIKMIPNSDAIMTGRGAEPRDMCAPVNIDAGVVSSKEGKLPISRFGDAAGSKGDPPMGVLTAEVQADNSDSKTALIEEKPLFLKVASTIPAPSSSNPEMTLKRPLYERKTVLTAPLSDNNESLAQNQAYAQGRTRVKGKERVVEKRQSTPDSSSRRGTGTEEAMASPVSSPRARKLPKPSGYEPQNSKGRHVSPTSDSKPPVMPTWLARSDPGNQGRSPALNSEKKKRGLLSVPPASSSDRKKPVFEPTPFRAAPEVEKEEEQGKKPVRPSFANAPGDPVFGKRVSPVKTSDAVTARLTLEKSQSPRKDKPVPQPNQVPWKKTSKPTSVHNTEKTRSPDGARHENKVQLASCKTDTETNLNAGTDNQFDRARNSRRKPSGGRRSNVGKEYGGNKRDKANRENSADIDLRNRALQEVQRNKSVTVERDAPLKKKSQSPAFTTPDHVSVEEKKKELGKVFVKGNPGKADKPASSTKSLENAATEAPKSICHNHIENGSCTILDMLQSGASGGREKSVYCRVQVKLRFGTGQSTYEPSKWIHFTLGARLTKAKELRISEVNEEALSVLRRSGNAAKQKSPGMPSSFVRRGPNLQQDLPILLNPFAILNFSFDPKTRDRDTDPVSPKKKGEIGDSRGEAVVNKGRMLKEIAQPHRSTTASRAPEVLTGYEKLKSRFDIPSAENAGLSDEQLNLIDDLPESGADFTTALDGASYPPLEAVDSMLETLHGIELDHGADEAGQAQRHQSQDKAAERRPVKPKNVIIPLSAPFPNANEVVRNGGRSREQSSVSPLAKALSPDTVVIDLVEEPGKDASSNREEVTFGSDYRKFTMKLMTAVADTLSALTERKDMQLRRPIANSSY